jgi:AraC-like DNA-binding protein
VVEAALLSRLDHRNKANESTLGAVQLILRSGGLLPIEMIGSEVGISARQLGRRFETVIGLSPKLLSRIVRFQRLFRLIESRRFTNWALLALECGYYDQSHLIRDFRAFTGSEPTSYFSQPNEISGHFIERN